ncbi:hypothetical protein DVH24_031405 [Malus domestica]|uniref:Uncharacterized protein n=1 Tax=Malus domestica TaxID=3750 RepID=A0A498HGR8_MALDO|nr:hypothetical protein DVH24_031405 [Malus domestica]
MKLSLSTKRGRKDITVFCNNKNVKDNSSTSDFIISNIKYKINNKNKKYDYTTLTKCFDIVDDLIDWEINAEKELDPDHDSKFDRRRNDQDTPPFPRQNDRRGCKDKQTPPKQKQYMTFLSSKGPTLFLTIWPRKNHMNTTPSTSALVTPPKVVARSGSNQ